MYPIFITDDPDARVEIPSLPGQCRWGVNRLDEFLVRWRGCRVLFVRRATVRLLPPSRLRLSSDESIRQNTAHTACRRPSANASAEEGAQSTGEAPPPDCIQQGRLPGLLARTMYYNMYIIITYLFYAHTKPLRYSKRKKIEKSNTPRRITARRSTKFRDVRNQRTRTGATPVCLRDLPRPCRLSASRGPP